MRTFIIDDEDALCRHLAAKTWTKEFVTAAEKELQEKLKRQNIEAASKNFLAMLDEIKANKCKTGQENPAKKKKMIMDNFSKTIASYA